MVVDPDWKPNMSLIKKEDLAGPHDSYQFKIWDRSGITTRNCNWLMAHKEGHYFDYYVHEFLRFKDGGPFLEAQNALSWEVSEVESDSSWHQTVGHGAKTGASRTYKRFLFDVSLLLKEQADPRYADSAHTLYYMGAAHCALVEADEEYKLPFLNKGEKLTDRQRLNAQKGVEYLEKRIEMHLSAPERELTWSAFRWLAYAKFYLLQDYPSALTWYGKCIAFDPERVDCKIELSKLHTILGDHRSAYFQALDAALTPYPDRSFSNNFYIYDCIVPLQTSRAVANYISFQSNYTDQLYSLGHHLGTKAGQRCTSGIPLEKPDALEVLGRAYDEIFYSTLGEPSSYSSSPPTTTFRCCFEDATLESEAIRFTGGKHYFCAAPESSSSSDSASASASALPSSSSPFLSSPTVPSDKQRCEKYGVPTQKVLHPMHDTSSKTPGHLYDILEHIGPFSGARPPSDKYSALFMATSATYHEAVRAACEFSNLARSSFDWNFEVYVGFGGLGSDVKPAWSAFLEEVNLCNACSEATAASSSFGIVGVFLDVDFSMSSKFQPASIDYVDLGAGMMNLEQVASPVHLLSEASSEVLKDNGAVGLLLHTVSYDNLQRFKVLRAILDGNRTLSGKARKELASALAKKCFGLDSSALTSQLLSISRSFRRSEVESLLSSAQLSFHSEVSVANGSASAAQVPDSAVSFELFATKAGSVLPQPPGSRSYLGEDSASKQSPLSLSESTVLYPRSPQMLDSLHKEVLKRARSLTAHSYESVSFERFTVAANFLTPFLISSTFARHSLADAYRAAAEDMNRRGNYLHANVALTFDSFMASAEVYVQEFAALKLISISYSSSI